MIEVGAIFQGVVKTAVKVKGALSVLAFDGGAGGESTIVGPGGAVRVAGSPAEAFWAHDNVEVTEEEARGGNIHAARVSDAVKTGADAGVGVVEVMNGGNGVGEAGAVAVEAVFERAGDGAIRSGRILSSNSGGGGGKRGSRWGRGDLGGDEGNRGRVSARKAGAFAFRADHGGGWLGGRGVGGGEGVG